MHLQRRPHEEAKLVRCVRGAIFDVVLDLRPDSDTYLRWHGVRLDEEEGTRALRAGGMRARLPDARVGHGRPLSDLAPLRSRGIHRGPLGRPGLRNRVARGETTARSARETWRGRTTSRTGAEAAAGATRRASSRSISVICGEQAVEVVQRVQEPSRQRIGVAAGDPGHERGNPLRRQRIASLRERREPWRRRHRAVISVQTNPGVTENARTPVPSSSASSDSTRLASAALPAAVRGLVRCGANRRVAVQGDQAPVPSSDHPRHDPTEHEVAPRPGSCRRPLATAPGRPPSVGPSARHDAGRVDDDVDGPELALDLVDDRVDEVLVEDVARARDQLGDIATEQLRGSVEALARPAVDRHRVSLDAECSRDLEPDSTSSARNDRDGPPLRRSHRSLQQVVLLRDGRPPAGCRRSRRPNARRSRAGSLVPSDRLRTHRSAISSLEPPPIPR